MISYLCLPSEFSSIVMLPPLRREDLNRGIVAATRAERLPRREPGHRQQLCARHSRLCALA
jgi:hypothetical protein